MRNGGGRRQAVASTLCVLIAVLAGVVPAARGDVNDPSAGPQPGAWAVVIGIDHYANGENLQSARADAGDMDQVLANDGIPADHRLFLTDEQATGANIRAAADWLVSHSTDATTAVFFFAGHVDKLSANTEALRGSDLVKVTDAELAGHFRRLHARAAWFTIAGCFAGGFNELLAPGRILTAASDANDQSYENEDFGRSYLDEYMIRRGMLLGAANSSVQAAFQYAANSLQQDYPDRVPLEWDEVGWPVDLRTPATPPPPPAPAAMTTPVSGAVPSGSQLAAETAAARPDESAPTASAPTPQDSADRPPTPPPAVVPPAPSPIEAITHAIDRITALRAQLVSWMTRSPANS